MIYPGDVLHFWFKELTGEQQFKVDPVVDEKIKTLFGALVESAAKGELFSWRSTAEGRLAEIIVLDQFSRNIYRNDPRAFAQDTMALILAQEMVELGLEQEIDLSQRAFVFMPYMHSESRLIHEEAVKLFSLPGLENNLKFEYKHKEVIDQFGRYPHRNETLGRKSTPAELEFLKSNPGW
jgi:uncharacterized protein (DUF924 family)